MSNAAPEKPKFLVYIVAPSHYDDEGYVIQWRRTVCPSNSLACLVGLAEHVRDHGRLGREWDIVVEGYDERSSVIPVRRMRRRIRRAGGAGVVLLAGVQTNQFPRAMDLARPFRADGIPVVAGGFHVSGCLAMLDEMPPDLRQAQEMGVALFAGEAEGRLEGLLRDAASGSLAPIYNYLGDLPDLRGQPMPVLPRRVRRGSPYFVPLDTGRGCPFACTFCTIVNVQGRASRSRDPADIERFVRAHVARGAKRFFLTDDNFARNAHWEAILDRLIALRQTARPRFKLMMQVDCQSHRIPGFVEKAARAGCRRVFVGIESMNPANLAAAGKHHNRLDEYREALQAWRRHKVLIYAGYIIGFPADTPESIERDVRALQEHVPVDTVEFGMLTPLPGSADHRALVDSGVWLDPDMNRYDGEHATTEHPTMTADEWRRAQDRAWDIFYETDHVKTLLRRSRAGGAGMKHVMSTICFCRGIQRIEHVHPFQGGALRRRVRTTRRGGREIENPLTFYPQRWWQSLRSFWGMFAYFRCLDRMRKRIARRRRGAEYTDAAVACEP